MNNLSPDIEVDHLAPSKSAGQAHPVALFQKISRMSQFCLHIVPIDIGLDFNLFDFDMHLRFSIISLALVLIVSKFSHIHDLAHGGIGVGRYLDQIKALLLSLQKSISLRENSHLLSLCIN